MKRFRNGAEMQKLDLNRYVLPFPNNILRTFLTFNKTLFKLHGYVTDRDKCKVQSNISFNTDTSLFCLLRTVPYVPTKFKHIS